MLEQYETALYEWIEGIVAKGDEDALFASGYLQGHFSVVLSQLETQQDQGLEALANKMEACLVLAKEELEENDYALVEAAWVQLNDKISATVTC